MSKAYIREMKAIITIVAALILFSACSSETSSTASSDVDTTSQTITNEEMVMPDSVSVDTLSN